VRRDRLLVASSLLLVIVLSWGRLLADAAMMQDMGGALMPMSSGPWTPGRHAAIVLVMWAVMMAAVRAG
jgi:hypothetical protein